MEKWKGKVAVVTGVSAGIGAAIVENLVENGLLVVGLARRLNRLEELAGKFVNKPGKFYPYAVDLTIEEEIVNAFKWTKKNVGPVHILINNAGVTKYTSLQSGVSSDWKSILDTNVLALSIATREALEDMKANNVNGHIIHINSVLGHVLLPQPIVNHMYAASKHAVTALAEALRIELAAAGRKIKVTSLSPGAVRTEFGEAGNFPQDVLKSALANLSFLSAEDVANAVEYVLSTPPHVQVHEFIVTGL